MTSEIEAKLSFTHEEFGEILKLSPKLYRSIYDKIKNKGKREGKEMARKEFLQIIDNKIKYLEHPKNEVSRALIYFLNDLKQQLGEKSQ